MPALRRLVRCRSMPAVWSAPDERREWRPVGRGTARPGAFAEVILVFHPRRRYRVAESRDFAAGAWSQTGRIVASLALLRAAPLIAGSANRTGACFLSGEDCNLRTALGSGSGGTTPPAGTRPSDQIRKRFFEPDSHRKPNYDSNPWCHTLIVLRLLSAGLKRMVTDRSGSSAGR
jgi:hypothetical protein